MARIVAVILGVGAAALAIAIGVMRTHGGLGPGDAAETVSRLSFLCAVDVLCPVPASEYGLLERAVGGEREAQYALAMSLMAGRGVARDRKAGMLWLARAAEAGSPFAADYVGHLQRNGENIEVDETKMAAALKRQADAGDVQSMQALAPMMIRGRGLAQDPQAGIAMLLKAAEHSRFGEIEYQIAELYLIGTNGLAHDHEEAMKWYARAAQRGNVTAMSTLGGLWENVPWNDLIDAMRSGQTSRVFKPDVVQSYCWRARAAQMGSALAQYELALMLSRRSSDSRGNVIEPDLVLADFWFRLGARTPSYDNSQVRAAIEPKLTTAQLDQAKKMSADWHVLDFDQLKATPISVPGNAGRTCPPL